MQPSTDLSTLTDEDLEIYERLLAKASGAASPSASARHQAADYPHVCPRCGGPAYVGLNSVDCRDRCGR